MNLVKTITPNSCGVCQNVWHIAITYFLFVKYLVFLIGLFGLITQYAVSLLFLVFLHLLALAEKSWKILSQENRLAFCN